MVPIPHPLVNFGNQGICKKDKSISLKVIVIFCKRSIQDVKHLFAECPSVGHLWENLGKCIFKKIGLNFYIVGTLKILYYLNFDKHFQSLNFLLLTT